MVVSPTYFGACADVAGTGRGRPRARRAAGVDEAWGAHLHFHPDLPPDALGCGADLVISSTHKIVGSLTQSAMLHLGHGGRLDAAVVDRCVSLVETTSPSALLSGSLDARPPPGRGPRRRAARRDAGGHRGHARGDRADPRPRRARRQHGRPRRHRRLGPAAAGDRRARHRHHRLSPGARGLREQRRRLRAATRRTWSSRSSASPSRPRRRASAWSPPCARRSSGSAGAARRNTKLAPPPPWGELVMTPREAFLGPQEVIPFDQASAGSRPRDWPPTRRGSPTCSLASA